MKKLLLGLALALGLALPAQAQQAITVKDATVTSMSGGGTLCVHADNNGKLGAAAADCGTGLASIADKRILANISGGSAAPIANTFSDILDAAITCSAQGDIIFRGASGWSCLAPGTTGKFLKTQGASADLVWATAAGTGDVVGPGSSTTHNLASFGDTTGKLLEDSGIAKANVASTAADTRWASRIAGKAAVTLTDSSTISWDASLGNTFKVTLGGNRTVAAPSNPEDGATVILYIIQDGSGSRTLTWNSVFKWPGATAPTLSTGASKIDMVSCSEDGTNFNCALVGLDFH